MVSSAMWVPDRRDVIFIDCSPNAGKEIADVHPLLVLSPKAFNEKTGIVIGFPMTHAAFNANNPFAIAYTTDKKKTAYILAYQPKSFDWRQRGASLHPMKAVPEDKFEEACETLNQIIAICN